MRVHDFENAISDVIKNNQATFNFCEEIRKKKIKEYIIDVCFIILLAIISLKVLSLPILLALFVIPVGSIYFLMYKIHEYQIEYKKTCFPLIAEILGFKSIVFDLDKTEHDKIYFDSKLFDNFSFYTLSDFFEAKHNSTLYKLIEITLFAGEKYYSKIFQGIVVIYPFKYSKEHIIITTKGNKIASKSKKIKISNQELKKKFNFYCVNREITETELFRNVPTYITKCLIDLQKSYSTKKVKCAIFQDKIMVAISLNTYLFLTGNLFKSCFDIKSQLNLLKNIQPVSNFIKYLDNKSVEQGEIL